MKRKLFRGQRGGATVEFSIIAILLLMVLFGIIEFGIYMFDRHILTNASREGARAGIVMRAPRVPDRAIPNPDTLARCPFDPYRIVPDGTPDGKCVPAGIQDIVEWYAKEHMVSFGASSTLDFGPWPDEDPEMWISPAEADRKGSLFGRELIVKVKYPFDFFVLSGFGLEPITLIAETRMRME